MASADGTLERFVRICTEETLNLRINYARSRTAAIATFIIGFVCFLDGPAFGQQSYIGQYEVFAGYTDIRTPFLNLSEPGFHLQAGIKPRTWAVLGVDYSRGTGNTFLTANILKPALQEKLSTILGGLQSAGLEPANYTLSVPYGSTTQTVAAGPEFSYRGFNRWTPFIRPSAGAVQDVATLHPSLGFETLAVRYIAPSEGLQEWTMYYGVGGGLAFNVTRHFSLVMQADFVHERIFTNVLNSGSNTIRISVGPAFQFGKNMRE
jgi:hypothetical protein